MPDAEPGSIRVASPVGRWVVLTTVLGSSMAMLDSTVINVALPRIGEDLGTDLAALQWTVNAYMLTLAGLILLGGALGDRYGRRRVFVVGVVWFALASLLCGVAPNAAVLIAARALQGVGGALLTPGSLALIQASFHPDDRARAVGLWSGLGGVGAAVGPFVGGWLVDGPGWRWVFLLNLPLAAICVPVALRHVPESRDPAAHGRFDVLGAVLGALALAGVTYALIEAPGSGASPLVIGSAVGGVLLGVAFVQVERRRSDPMLPPSIFRSRLFTSVNIVTFCVYAALGGFFFLSAIQLQVVAGYSALGAGTALLPTTVLMLLFSASAGDLGRRIGPRIPLTVGPLLAAAGMLLMLRVGPGASVTSYLSDVLPAVLVLGLGLVTLVAPLTATVLAAVDAGRAGLASGINNAAARAAGLIAVAALPLLAGMGPEAYRDAGEFAATFRRAMPMCAGLLVAGAVIAFWTVRTPPAADRDTRPECAVHCGVAAPPLEPEHEPHTRAGT
ncbi:DHA2 family efflux MFS transporter permease subunit [Streptomyces sp. BE308]|uniref:DHA2 family efflux MFS transporter permease subunit n=1 Tax=unclassified Streptomyces TaxID=2593676 RepID=UPI002DD89622|nr:MULTISPECIES: DHA2 family efflux MFS transporter permease subunit [unclassified Streptomyces]MEE1789863.1 DHA2 family efflux MFS transporter permease subunit [Streptomyces sp. BE308]WRZ73452.1 DHA2 family efflux MFS transporter permease subunit [Streptomyces sp. NBC_01237]